MPKKGEHMSEEQKRRISEVIRKMHGNQPRRPVFFRMWISKEEDTLLRKACELTNDTQSGIVRRGMNRELARLGLYSEEKNKALLRTT
jgi:hypothetical protein